MSVVCVKKYPNKFVFAADSMMVRGSTKMNHLKFAKLESVNGMVIGFAGSAAEGNLLNIFARTNLPSGNDEKDILDYFFKFSLWKRDNGGSNGLDNDYIFGYDKKAFFIEGNDMFVKEIDDYHAIGSGEKYALAALYLGSAPEDATKVACDLNCYVGEPIIAITMER